MKLLNYCYRLAEKIKNLPDVRIDQVHDAIVIFYCNNDTVVRHLAKCCCYLENKYAGKFTGTVMVLPDRHRFNISFARYISDNDIKRRIRKLISTIDLSAFQPQCDKTYLSN